MNSLCIKIQFKPHKEHSMLPSENHAASQDMLCFMQYAGLLLCPQIPATALYTEPLLSGSIFRPYFSNIDSDIIFLLHLCLSCGFSQLGILTKILWKFLLAPDV